MGYLKKLIPLRKAAEESVSTLPALIMKAEKIASNTLHGSHGQRKAGSGEKFWQFREYQETDRPQDIDWRQSAKTDQVFIKQKEWQTPQKTYFWCAGGASMNFTSNTDHPTKMEAAQILCLALALLLYRSEEHIGFFGNAKTGHSERKIEVIAHALLARANHNIDLPNTQNFILPSRASFIGCGDFLSPLNDIKDTMSQIASVAQNGILIQVLDPAELNLNFEGRVEFISADESQKELINNVSAVKEAYAERINNHIQSIKQFCHENNWTYILHQTNVSISKTVRDVYLLMDQENAL